MSKKSRAKLEKKKQRERRVRHERNVRQARPAADQDDFEDELDLPAALESLPIDLQFERISRRIARVTGRRSFAGSDDLEAELAKLGPVGSPRANELGASDSREDAHDVALLALDPQNVDHVEDLVELALELDPENVDAAVLKIVLDGRSSAGTVSALEALVARAERALGDREFLDANRGRSWEDVLARPYLRARRMLASALRVSGRQAEAEAHFNELLQLVPDDQLEIGDVVLGFALERGELERVRGLLARKDEYCGSVKRWAGALERWMSGDRERAAESVRAGREENHLVERVLLSSKPVELASRKSSYGHLAIDADLVGSNIGAAWRACPKALAWLAGGALATTPDEREAVCASFAPPVSALLAIGGAGLTSPWPDYSAIHGLRGDDVAEILRMATEPAMHELEEDDPRTWAAPHAWRALGTLAAADAVEPLLALALSWPDDDQLLSDLPEVFTRIGDAALPPLIARLRDASSGEFARMVACESLAKVGASDPGRRDRVLAAFAAELERCQENDAQFNGWLVAALLDLHAVELASEIRSMFERDLVDPGIAGDWETVAEELGVA